MVAQNDSVINYTPVQADVTAGHLRVCHFYTDLMGANEGFAEGVTITGALTDSNQGTEAQRLAGTICTAALEVTDGSNREASGNPAIHLSGQTMAARWVAVGNSVRAAVSDNGGNVMDDDGIPSAVTTSWQRSADGGTTWTEISGSPMQNSGAYGVADADEDAGHIRVCIFFTDSADNLEGAPADSTATSPGQITDAERIMGTLCSAAVPVNHLPTGVPYIATGSVQGNHFSADIAAPPSMLAVGNVIVPILSSSGTGPRTDPSLSASGPVTDDDGIATGGDDWRFSIQTAMADNGPWTEVSDESDASDSGIAYTITAADATAGYMRACIFYTDDAGNLEGAPVTSAATDRSGVTADERLMGTLCSVPVPVITPNIPASGEPAVAYASSISVPTEGSEITASRGTIMDGDGITTFTPDWQWSAATDNGGTYADITGNGAATNAFTPQQAHVGMFLQVCATFDDDDGDSETRCRQIADAVANVNDDPEGGIAVQVRDDTSSPTVGLGSLAVGTAYAPVTTVDGGDLSDADGYTDGDDSGVFSWQRSMDGGSSWSTEVHVANNGETISYTPVQADADAGHVRVCHFYTDGQGTVEGFAAGVTITGPTSDTNRGTEEQRLAGGICTAALRITGGNVAASGEPQVMAADNADLATVGPNEDSLLTAARGTIMDDDGIATFTPSWAWHVGDSADGDFMAIAAATGATFRPLQTHVGKFIRVCASFDDDDSNRETRCWTSAAAVANVNDDPTGSVAIVNKGGNGVAATVATEDTLVYIGITSMAGSIFDEDGLPFIMEPDNALRSISWQRGTASGGTTTWREVLWGLSMDVTPDAKYGIPYTPGDDDVGANITIRVCFFFVDGQGTLEGAPMGSSAAAPADLTESERQAGAICSVPIAVNNVNDVPMAQASSASVPVGGTLTFSSAQFLFDDADDHALASVIIETVPATGMGTLADAGTAITGKTTLTVAELNNDDLVYTPAADAAAGDSASFTFNVVDAGSDMNTSATAATFTISIVAAAANQPATGLPNLSFAGSVTAATEDSPVTVEIHNVNDPDGINAGTLMYQWSRADAPMSGVPMASAYANITGATMAAYTPGDDDVGKFLRACVTFSDQHSTPEESTLCIATPAAVINVPDAPMGDLHVAYGSNAAQPIADISAPDEDAAYTASAGTLSDADGLGTLSWQWQTAAAPPSGAPAADAYSDVAERYEDGSDDEIFTPDQPHVGRYMRICASYTDDQSGSHTYCQAAGGPIQNANDAPTAIASSLSAHHIRPTMFAAANFGREDTDGDALDAIIITTLPMAGTGTAGTLSIDGGTTALAAGDLPETVLVANIPMLTYTPAADSNHQDTASFRFQVRTGSGASLATSVAATTMSIVLIQPEDSTADGGELALDYGGAGMATEDSLITATIGDYKGWQRPAGHRHL